MSPKKRAAYREGDWFAVPLEQGGYALGLIARRRGSGILGYFFAPRFADLPTLEDAAKYRPADAIERLRFGDLDLYRGVWPVLGSLKNWDRASWPVPRFVQKGLISESDGLYFIRTYDDKTLKWIGNDPAPAEEVVNLPEDGVLGAGAVIIRLSRRLAEWEKRRERGAEGNGKAA